MARYCPLLGQFCAIAGPKIIRREENFARTIIAIWNRGCSLSCFARKNPTLDFTLHQIVWNPDKHRGCERWRVTPHSSQLFTTLHLMQEDKRWAAYLSRSSVIIDDQRWSSMMAEAGSMEWSRSLKKYRVKRGEEWWRVHSHSSPVQTSYIQLVMSYLWRVKSIFESSSLLSKRSKTPSGNVRTWAKSP